MAASGWDSSSPASYAGNGFNPKPIYKANSSVNYGLAVPGYGVREGVYENQIVARSGTTQVTQYRVRCGRYRSSRY